MRSEMGATNEPAQAPVAARIARMPTVMVVDDEARIVDLARDYLEHAGFEVITAGDGEAALETARAAHPDLVVLDLGLPGIDGLDVTRELRRESEIPIVMLTARDDELDRVLGLELGADDYITKPFSPRELVARVKAVLRRTAERAPEPSSDLVVAGEVRNLAQRSAAAAKEIKELISTSVDKIKGGTELVNKAGTTMDEILASVKHVTDIMAEITSASAEQSSGIEQVSLTVQQMDEVTQQNAALVEEASAAARSMEEQAGTMEELVQQFRVVQAVSGRSNDGVRKEAAPAKPVAASRPSAPAAKPAASRGGDKAGLNGHHAPAVASASDGAGAEQWTSF